MKKLILFSLAAVISLGAVAQHKGGKKNKANKHAAHHQKKHKKYDDDRNARWDRDRRDDDYRRNRDYDRNDDYRRNRDYDRNNGYSNNNLPRKVSDAFQRDYPNANNVSWTKGQGIWSANFKNGGLFGGNRTVSYRANGQRVDGNNVYGRNDRRTQQSSNNPIYDRVFN